jgi:ABC-type polysaccharide/polyol phosphate export permease
MPSYTGDSLFILRNLIAKDFKVRYRNMSLGILWSLVNPLVMMTVLTFVFTGLMPSPRRNFWLFVLIGLLPYNFFALAWSTGTTSIVDSGRLIKKVPFLRELVPLSTVFANSLHYLIQFGLLLVAAGLVIGPSWSWTWLPVVLALPDPRSRPGPPGHASVDTASCGDPSKGRVS